MLWSPFFHIYQPPTQFPEVLRDITKKSYEKIIGVLKRNPQINITLNINASLTEQLAAQGFQRLIAEIGGLVDNGQIELVESAAYHPILTKIPENEVVRQIKLNRQINSKYFGRIYKPVGFFPPEMAFSQKLAQIIDYLGYQWVIISETSFPESEIEYDRIYRIAGTSLKVFFRDGFPSIKIAFRRIKSASDLRNLLGERINKNEYLLTAMDGETFGHHIPKSESLFEQLLTMREMKTVRISDLFDMFLLGSFVVPHESTWGTTKKDLSRKLLYPKWDLPSNPIHRYQWHLLDIAIDTVQKSKFAFPTSHLSKRSEDPELAEGQPPASVAAEQLQWWKARDMLDKAPHSDQFWWASHNPCWHFQMVKKGAEMLREIVLVVPDSSVRDRQEAMRLCEEITTTGLELYGDTVII